MRNNKEGKEESIGEKKNKKVMKRETEKRIYIILLVLLLVGVGGFSSAAIFYFLSGYGTFFGPLFLLSAIMTLGMFIVILIFALPLIKKKPESKDLLEN